MEKLLIAPFTDHFSNWLGRLQIDTHPSRGLIGFFTAMGFNWTIDIYKQLNENVKTETYSLYCPLNNEIWIQYNIYIMIIIQYGIIIRNKKEGKVCHKHVELD